MQSRVLASSIIYKNLNGGREEIILVKGTAETDVSNVRLDETQ